MDPAVNSDQLDFVVSILEDDQKYLLALFIPKQSETEQAGPVRDDQQE